MTETIHDQGPKGSISLDQLIALNDELMALVRVGLPLEKGLRDAGKDLGGKLGATTEALAARLERGEDLVSALEAEGDRFPKVYRAVVEAGFRSGRLAGALEGLAAYARGYVHLRRTIGLALIYPILVLMLAYALTIWMVLGVLPKFIAAFASLEPGLKTWSLDWLGKIEGSVAYWGPIVPAGLLLFGFFYFGSGRSTALRGEWSSRVLRRVPWVGRMLENSRASGFSGMLALLVEQGVPLDEGLRLAAEAAGDGSLRRAAAAIADSLRAGDSAAKAVRSADRFPALVRWLLTTGRRQTDLAAGLRLAAETYRRRAARQAEGLRIVLPNVLLLVVGAGATLIYTLMIFGPLSILLRNLTL